MFLGVPRSTGFVEPWNQSFDERLATLAAGHRRIAYYYTTPDNSTFRYRCFNMVQSVNACAADATASWFCQADGDRLSRVVDMADVLVLGRVRFDADVDRLVTRARRRGARILFDVDDLVYDTRHVPLIMNSLDEDIAVDKKWDHWFAYVGRLGTTLQLCDGVITTNAFLAEQIVHDTGKPVAVVPNYLNRRQQEVSEAIMAAKRRDGWIGDGRIHIGYFSGSPSHARDFAIVAPTLAALLAEDRRIVVRMVGYLDKHPALAPFAARVEVHPFTDFIDLQGLIGSTEINLAPLQDNVFTNGKSELKYFEAAAVGTVTVASPAFTFRNSIEDGRTGYLANEMEWGEKIRRVISEIGGQGYRDMAQAGHEDTIRRYGWDTQWPAIERAAFGPLTAAQPLPPTMPRASIARSASVPRRDSILSMLDPASHGLEIGPSYNPLLPKAEGFNVETVDYTDQAGLRSKYAATADIDIGRIEAVDHVTGGRPISEVIPADRRYDFVLASHVIEHTPDLIAFLNDCAAVLKPGGRVVLAVPDKRFCFDILQPLTFAGEVLQAHADKRWRPTPTTVMNSIAYDMIRGGKIGWSPQEARPAVFASTLEAAMDLAEAVRTSEDYIDVHCWRFVPSSFRLLIEDLRALGAISLAETAFRHHGEHEFFVALAAGGPGSGLSRDQLAARILDEVSMRRL